MQEKNEQARRILCKITSDCVWMNVHTLPHALHVFEIRNSRGYGARWTADGQVRAVRFIYAGERASYSMISCLVLKVDTVTC